MFIYFQDANMDRGCHNKDVEFALKKAGQCSTKARLNWHSAAFPECLCGTSSNDQWRRIQFIMACRPVWYITARV